MLTFLPPGLMGLMVASLLALYMSAVSGQLNFGSFYIVNDFYKRFVRPDAGERELVLVGRLLCLLLMVVACLLAPLLLNAKRAFDLILQVGAGTGLVFILRWFWWRINAFSEIAAMAVSFVVAGYFELVHAHTGLPQLVQWQQLVLGVGVTTICWVVITLATRPADDQTLINFCRVVRAGGPGWEAVVQRAKASGISIEGAGTKWDVPYGMLCLLFGSVRGPFRNGHVDLWPLHGSLYPGCHCGGGDTAIDEVVEKADV
jgi:Na+/proline symporter